MLDAVRVYEMLHKNILKVKEVKNIWKYLQTIGDITGFPLSFHIVFDSGGKKFDKYPPESNNSVNGITLLF